MPKRLELTVEGERGQLSFETLATVIRNSFDILTNLDSAVSSQPRGSLDWFVTDISFGSLIITIEARPKLPDVDNGPKVVGAMVNGLAHIQREHTTPPYFSDYELRKADAIARALQKEGARAVRIRDIDEKTTAIIEPEISSEISQLIKVRYQEIGSVEGRLEMISIHRQPRFSVYHSITQRSVRCKFESKILDMVKEALGRRVIVSGVVYYNYRHEPIRVDLQKLTILPREEELPSPKDLRGMVPDFTGDKTTEEYVRSLRE